MNDDFVAFAQMVYVIKWGSWTSAMCCDNKIANLTGHCGACVVSKSFGELLCSCVFYDPLTPDPILQAWDVDGR